MGIRSGGWFFEKRRSDSGEPPHGRLGKVWDSSMGTSGQKRLVLSQLLWVRFIERRNISIDSVKKA